jgi:hypothetical protein
MTRWKAICRVLVSTFAAAAVCATGTVAAGAASTAKAGVAYVVAPNGSALTSGGSATPFTLALPATAACPADTFRHGYLVYSYVTPASMDPGHLTFPGGFPSSNLDLITTTGEPYITNATAPYTGSILRLPAFVWSRYDHHPEVLPPGTYNVGIACAHNLGRVEAYWNNRIQIMASSSDSGGFTWRAVGAVPSSTSSSPTGLIVGLVLAATAILSVGLAWGLRRPRRTLADEASGAKSAV